MSQSYRMPAEWEKHEGTWLQWPHMLTHGTYHYQLRLEGIWLQIVQGLYGHENIHIVACDEAHRDHIEAQLKYFGMGGSGVDFHIIPTNDVWARDTGAIFVHDQVGKPAAIDWKFNGWGNRFEHDLDEKVAGIMGGITDVPILTPSLVLEGGSVEINGNKTFMGTRSSILNDNRNPNVGQDEVEKLFRKYFGVDHFIWLSGVGNEDSEKLGGVTDTHIDGTARFTNENTVVHSIAEDENDSRYSVYSNIREELKKSSLSTGKKLDLIELPIPRNGVHQVTPVKWSKTTVTPASYCNFYVANGVVLVPLFGNVNDERARKILSEQFPQREIIGINVVNLIENGGALHCVTQQQPLWEYSL